VTRHLADACALVGFYLGRPDFPPGLRALIEDEAGTILVAATTVWEIAIKVAKGGLPDIRDPRHPTLASMFRAQGFGQVPLTPETAELAAGLPPHHRDPFDRALVAEALRTGLPILTDDAMIARYGVAVRW
jgi:PIN domain nuclease of toxin-antitoxin system